MSLITFSSKYETNFIVEGFDNLKKCPVSFREHESSSTHREIKVKFDYIHKARNVKEEVTKQNTDEKAIRREILVKQLRALRYLARQGLAIRGKKEGDGNFEQLQYILGETCPQYQQWFKSKDYQSPTILNEQIKLLGNTLLREKLKQIYGAKWFSILAVETRDIANREQLSISIRWADDDFVVFEDFIGLVELTDTSAQTIYLSIKDVLIRLSLSLENCRGQAYDGASNFMGKENSK
ncbi:uncharacterized protein LOC123539827 [Mercenaria mercenaria]|uniref:uncharacterized protein LOC123539827 n=1 Tax=Mercenaria mercenaria TaxID=6596 RepID=UPI00234EA17F|nr:uncharacterized protein LOC123539827 [Mercenaria mercenaria]